MLLRLLFFDLSGMDGTIRNLRSHQNSTSCQWSMQRSSQHKVVVLEEYKHMLLTKVLDTFNNLAMRSMEIFNVTDPSSRTMAVGLT
jgi:hypothetical protein